MKALYKLVQILTHPETWILLCLFVGWILSRSSKRSSLAPRVLLFGLVLFMGLSTRPATELLLRPLELMYAPPSTDTLLQHDAIVVLGGGYRFHPQTGEANVFHTQGLDRLICGLVALRNRAAPLLVLSGGPRWLFDMAPSSDAEAMRNLAVQLGAPPSALVLEPRSLNTAGEATEIKNVLPDATRILLVTSALHLPRSVRLFQQQGFDVTPMPCDYVTERTGWGFEDFLPSALRLNWTRAAIHEYAGLAVLWLTN